MIRAVNLIAIASLALALSGCTDFGSASGVVGTAGSALQKNDAKLFFQTLTGGALTQYGNLKAMAALREELSGYDKIAGKKAKFIDSQGKLEHYSIVVQGKKGKDWVSLYDARVVCETDQHFQPGTPGACHPGPNGTVDCLPGSPGEWQKTSYCQISALQKL